MTDDTVLSTLAKWKNLTDQVDNWSLWLAEGDEGNDNKKYEQLSGRRLRFRPQARPIQEK